MVKKRHLSDGAHNARGTRFQARPIFVSRYKVTSTRATSLISRVLNLSLEWDKALSLHGPDGTVVNVVGKGETQEAITPLREDSIPWNFKRIDQDSLRSMVRDLLPCEEGKDTLTLLPGKEHSQVDPLN